MSKNLRRKFSSEFKAKIAIAAIKERQTTEQICKEHDLHPNQVSDWKKQFLAGAASVFEGPAKKETKESEHLVRELYAQIGEQKVAIDFLKKKLS